MKDSLHGLSTTLRTWFMRPTLAAVGWQESRDTKQQEESKAASGATVQGYQPHLRPPRSPRNTSIRFWVSSWSNAGIRKGRAGDTACPTPALDVDFDKLIAAMQTYVDRQVAPVWGTPAKLVKTKDFKKGAWAMVFGRCRHAGCAGVGLPRSHPGLPQSKIPNYRHAPLQQRRIKDEKEWSPANAKAQCTGELTQSDASEKAGKKPHPQGHADSASQDHYQSQGPCGSVSKPN